MLLNEVKVETNSKTLQVECEVIKKIHRVRATVVVKRFSFKVLHVAWPVPQRKRAETGTRTPPSHETFCCWVKASNCFKYNTDRNVCHQRLVSLLHLWFQCTVICPHLRSSVSYTKCKVWDFIIYEDYFIKVKIYIALNSKVRINCLKTL